MARMSLSQLLTVLSGARQLTPGDPEVARVVCDSRQVRPGDLFVAIGTSGVVYPAAGFVRQALAQGASTVEINRELSEVTGLFHHQRQGLATVEVARLVEELLAG